MEADLRELFPAHFRHSSRPRDVADQAVPDWRQTDSPQYRRCLERRHKHRIGIQHPHNSVQPGVQNAALQLLTCIVGKRPVCA
jgi:hypothetical protein